MMQGRVALSVPKQNMYRICSKVQKPTPLPPPKKSKNKTKQQQTKNKKNKQKTNGSYQSYCHKAVEFQMFEVSVAKVK